MLFSQERELKLLRDSQASVQQVREEMLSQSRAARETEDTLRKETQLAKAAGEGEIKRLSDQLAADRQRTAELESLLQKRNLRINELDDKLKQVIRLSLRRLSGS